MRKTNFLTLAAGAFILANSFALAEDAAPTAEELKGQIDGQNEKMLEMDATLQKLAKIKLSGYIQTQFVKSEADNGINTDPYNSKDAVKGGFQLRRARVKVAYDEGSTSLVVQGDFLNTGFHLKEAYLQFTEPWLKYFTVNAGIFNRPNFEVEYSSSSLESMERSTLISKLYPGEYDLGLMLTATPENLFKLQLAGFNNTMQGTQKQYFPNFNQAPLYYMARLTKDFKLADDLGLDLGVHARTGDVVSNTYKVLESDISTSGAIDSTSLKVGDKVNRSWFGAEAQLYYDFLGGMKIMGEFITGSDVNELSTTASSAALRKRDFNGYYVTFVKTLGDEWQLVAKYDSYNPNTKIDDKLIASTGDLAINTLGFGIHNFSFANVRISLWYDMPQHKEISGGKYAIKHPYTGVAPTKNADGTYDFNDPIDNKLTVRFQYKF